MLEIRNCTRFRVPDFGASHIFKLIFPRENLEMSLVFTGDTRMRSLNRRYRGKDKTTDVLSFRLDDNLGELFISVPEAKRQVRKRKELLEAVLQKLAIHGMLHIKGYDHERSDDHGAMETLENRIFQKLQ